MKYNKLIISTIVLLLILTACRREWLATEEDMANYGWTLFEQATTKEEYKECYDWFSNSVREDENYQDGYNGMGWALGKMVELDSAVQTFMIGLTKPQNPRMVDIVAHDILAGLTFAHSALKDDSSAVHYGDSLIWLIEQKIGEKIWVFPHDTTTNYLDVHVTLALSYYGLSEFVESLGHVQSIWAVLEPTKAPYVVNTSTIVGRNQLAAEIEYLQYRLRGR